VRGRDFEDEKWRVVGAKQPGVGGQRARISGGESCTWSSVERSFQRERNGGRKDSQVGQSKHSALRKAAKKGEI